MGVGATFGESVLWDAPREATVVTRSTCELLRVEQRDFRLIWEKNKDLMGDLVNSNKLKNGFGPGISKTPPPQPQSPPPAASRRPQSPPAPNASGPITEHLGHVPAFTQEGEIS
ncbi:rap guanine nucleotide exchange factor 4-like [Schistocerca cancellata]|uniref:rap guanine nucleotide exchange factor 4-like n=1 Tax=Schistocerca cancellata TaxID=274614 RepID=UPI00211927AC|nr:rap guanine nucleotide exchange factor 4-like [Schistocerca cancellata]